MNEMETLYDEYKRLRDELNGRALDEIGAFELRNYRRRFERYCVWLKSCNGRNE